MQVFIARFEKEEKKLELLLTSTPSQLHLLIQHTFGLEECKIANLVKKKRKKIDDDELITLTIDDYYILKPNQKLLILGSKFKINPKQEQNLLKKQEEFFQEEINYDQILQRQAQYIAYEIPKKQFLKLINLKQRDVIPTIQTLCYHGDIENLKIIWESEQNTIREIDLDLNNQVNDFVRFGILGDQIATINFFIDHGKRLNYKDLIRLASKYGRLHLLEFFTSQCKEHPSQFVSESITNAITNGHFRVLKWMYNKYKNIEIVFNDFNIVCRKNYERIVKWILLNFIHFLEIHEDCLLITNLNILDSLLKTKKWKESELNKSLKYVINENNIKCVQLLIQSNANMDAQFDSGKTTIIHHASVASLEMLQFLVQTMQLKRPLNWCEPFDTKIRCDILKYSWYYQHGNENDITLYLLNVNIISPVDYGNIFQTYTKNQITTLKEIFQSRVDNEVYANEISIQASSLFISLQFPVDVNRICLQYVMGTDGRHAKKFRDEFQIFVEEYDLFCLQSIKL